MHPTEDLGLTHFLANADPLSRGILVILIVMSLVSWYLILSRALLHVLDHGRGQLVLRTLPQLDSPAKLEAFVRQHPATDPLTALAAAGVEAGLRFTQCCGQRPMPNRRLQNYWCVTWMKR